MVAPQVRLWQGGPDGHCPCVRVVTSRGEISDVLRLRGELVPGGVDVVIEPWPSEFKAAALFDPVQMTAAGEGRPGRIGVDLARHPGCEMAMFPGTNPAAMSLAPSPVTLGSSLRGLRIGVGRNRCS